MHKYVLATVIGIALIGAGLRSYITSAVAAESQESAQIFLPDGKAKLPTGFRRWVFVGAPLTPEGLNNGKYNCDQPGGCTKSNFPEYHHVYIEQKNVDGYLKTGTFPEGTVIVKELTRVLKPTVSRQLSHGTIRTRVLQRRAQRHRHDGEGQQAIRQDQRLGLLHLRPSSQAVRGDSGGDVSGRMCGCHIANVAKTDMT